MSLLFCEASLCRLPDSELSGGAEAALIPSYEIVGIAAAKGERIERTKAAYSLATPAGIAAIALAGAKIYTITPVSLGTC